jgi:hypothetical protein
MKVTSIVHFAPASSVIGQFPIVALNSGAPETPSISTGKRDLFFFPFGFETLKCFIFDAPTLTEPKFTVFGIFKLTGTGVGVAVGVGVAAVGVGVAVAV